MFVIHSFLPFKCTLFLLCFYIVAEMYIYVWSKLTTRQIRKETQEIRNKYPAGENKEESTSLSCKNLPELSLPLLREGEKCKFISKSSWWILICHVFPLYENFYCEFPECLFLPALPRWLSHRSAFIGSSAEINGYSVVEDFVPKPRNLNACGIIGYRALQHNEDWGQQSARQGDISGNWKCWSFQLVFSFHSTTHLTVCRAPRCISFTLSAVTCPILCLCREGELFVLCSESSPTNLVCEHRFLHALSEKTAITKISSSLEPFKMPISLHF